MLINKYTFVYPKPLLLVLAFMPFPLIESRLQISFPKVEECSQKNCLEFNTFVSGPVPYNGIRERERLVINL